MQPVHETYLIWFIGVEHLSRESKLPAKDGRRYDIQTDVQHLRLHISCAESCFQLFQGCLKGTSLLRIFEANLLPVRIFFAQ